MEFLDETDLFVTAVLFVVGKLGLTVCSGPPSSSQVCLLLKIGYVNRYVVASSNRD